MTIGHCDPTPSGQLVVPAFPGGAPINLPSGSIRGLVVIMQGLQNKPVTAYPPPIFDDAGGGIFPLLYQTFSNDLLADHWATVFAPTPGQLYKTSQSLGILHALNNDGVGQGAGLSLTWQLWWDMVFTSVRSTLGPWPIVPFGISLGALVSLTAATKKTSTIAAYGAHIAPLKLWSANPAVINSGGDNNGFFGTADWTAAVAAGSNGVTLPISGGVLNISGLTGATPAANGTLVIVRGGGGWQILNYTGFNGTNQFTGVTGGNTADGALATGDVVKHSAFTTTADIKLTGLNALPLGSQGVVPPGWIGCETGDDFIGYADQVVLANTASGSPNNQPVTLYEVSGGNHCLSAADVTAAMSWFTGTGGPDSICPAVH